MTGSTLSRTVCRGGQGLLRRYALAAVVAAAAALCACNPVADTDMPKQSVSEVLARHSAALMSVPGVVGTGEGLCDGAPCIKVYVEQATPALRERVPETLEGYAVALEETGEVRPLEHRRDE